MKKFLFISFLIFICFSETVFSQIACSETFNVDWISNLGGAYADNITDVKTDAYNNILITGYIKKVISYRSQNYDLSDTMAFFVAKLNQAGNLLWLKTADISENTNNINNYKLAIDNNNNVFVLGTYLKSITMDGTTLTANNNGNDIFLLKFSELGNLIFANSYGSAADDYSGGIAIDGNNNIIFSGSFTVVISINGNVIPAYGAYDSFTVKLNNNGLYIWSCRYASIGDDFAKDIACDSDGNIYMIGSFTGILSSSAGNLTSTEGQQDLYILKLNPTGTAILIQKKPLVAVDYEVNRIFVTASGEFYVTYTCSDNTKVSKYNNAGVNTLNLSLGSGSTNLKARGIVVDNLGYIYVSGEFSGTLDFGDGIYVGNPSGTTLFVVKYRDNGTFVDKRVGTNVNGASGNSICFQDFRNVVVVGNFYNSLTINPNSLSSYGNYDGFIMKLSNKFYFTSIEQISHSCSSNNNDVNIFFAGGVPPYSFVWSNGAVTQNLSGVGVGIYSVTATDNSGCQITANVEVVTPSGQPINLPSSITMCYFDTITLDAGNFNAFLWNTGETTQTINISQENTYSVTATDNNGCISTTSIIIQKLPNINILPDTSYICFNEELNLSAGNYQNYLWSDGSTDSYILVSNSGICSVRVYDGSCYYYDTTRLVMRPKFEISLGPDKHICDGQILILSLDTVYSEYSWQNGSSTDSVYVANTQGIYSVRVANQFGCHAADTIQLFYEYSPTVNLGNDTIVCKEQFLLSSRNTLQSCSYLWSTGQTTQNITIDISGTYWVAVTSPNNACVISDTITIEVYPNFSINLGGNKDICMGESVTFTLPENLSYIRWMTGDNDNSITVSTNETVSVYTLNEYGCIGEDSAKVTVHNVSFPYLGNDTILCLGVKFEIKPEESYPHYQWSTGGTASSWLVSSSGTYSLTVSDNYGCSNSDEIIILYENSPVITELSEIYGNITIVADSGYIPYSYSLDVMGNWQQDNIFSNCSEGEHTVFVEDANKCWVSGKITVRPRYKIPSFFTPNGDGFNDIWEIGGFQLYPDATAIIFDRFGKQLYVFSSGDRGWNGTYLGNPVPSDTYWYVVDFGSGIEPIKGSVTIKR